MKFNLKLIAGVGAAMLFAGGANAAVLTGTTTNFSKQGISTTGNITLPVAPGVVTAVLAADYKEGDDIFLSIAGAKLVSGTALTASMVCGGVTPPPLVIGIINVDTTANEVHMRVTQKNVVSTVGATCQITGLQVSRSTLAAGSGATLNYRAVTESGVAFDTGCATAPGTGNAGLPGTLTACPTGTTPNSFKLAGVVSQFAAELQKDADGQVVKKFDGVIDVEQDREEFVGRDWDYYYFRVRNRGNLAEAVADVDVTFTLEGNFSFNAGADGKCGTSDDEGDLLSNLAADYAEDCKSVSVTFPAPANGADTDWTYNYVEVVVPGVGSGIQLEPQEFNSEAVFGWGTTKTESIRFYSGEWTINGALIYVSYMPYGDNISRIVYLANKGAQEGTIKVSAFDNAGKTYKFDLGIAKKNTVTELSGKLDSALKAAGFSGSGKVAFVMTVNAPAGDIDVYSAYNVGGADRGTVVNSHNGGR